MVPVRGKFISHGQYDICLKIWSKHKVKMAGYWPSSCLLKLLWAKTKSRSIKIQKKKQNMNMGNIQLPWPNKLGQYRIYYMAKKRNSSCRTKAGNPKRAAQVANQNTGFSLTLEKILLVKSWKWNPSGNWVNFQ